MVVYLAARIKMGRGDGRDADVGSGGASRPGVPIIIRLDPVIDGIVFRMLRHHFCLSAQISPHLGIVKIKGWSRTHFAAIRRR
jgi:hypothetical protein